MGDEVLDTQARLRRIDLVDRQERSARVYNFEVRGQGNYFVGDGEVLVHNCEPIVLGETMAARVLPVADVIGAKTFQPRSTNPARWLPNQRAWIRKQIRSGRQIFDIGTDRDKDHRSTYYAAERSELLKAGYKREFRRWVTANVGGVERHSDFTSGATLKKSRMVSSHQVFEPFIVRCRELFDGQLSLHGFGEPVILIHPPDCAVRYDKAELKLVFHYEFGNPPWATVAARLPHGWKRLSLNRLLLKIAPDLAAKLQIADEVSALEIYAQFIDGYLQAVLRGDFSSIVPLSRPERPDGDPGEPEGG